MNRTATAERTTRETRVRVVLDLDGSGESSIRTGVGFFDHLLASLAHHALFDLEIQTTGDLVVDDHHTLEDTAITLGQALTSALGDRSGITRFGDAAVPMDEALARCALDLGGRAYARIELPLRQPMIGNCSTQNIPHALEAFSHNARLSVHLEASGINDHHIAEAAFKALARSLRLAVAIDPRRLGTPSTKGSL
jgi:imidazoleglycerol-phosphate dehydratase